jgi:hypothetical protein
MRFQNLLKKAYTLLEADQQGAVPMSTDLQASPDASSASDMSSMESDQEKDDIQRQVQLTEKELLKLIGDLATFLRDEERAGKALPPEISEVLSKVEEYSTKMDNPAAGLEGIEKAISDKKEDFIKRPQSA